MSNSKGSILISNANAVGTALVNKLGGTGYTPNEWSDKINLLGIADADIPTALAGITEGSYTGEDRGAIKICNANNVGTMLNKKFNTNRGFKPSEWESAISKLTALTTGTASGSVVTFSDGADDVPVVNCIASVDPVQDLHGYSKPWPAGGGKNKLENELTSQTLNGTTFTVNSDGSITISGTPSTQTRVYIKSGTAYTVNEVSMFSTGTMPTGTRVFAQKVSEGSTTYPTISPSSSLSTIGSVYSNVLLEIGTSFDGTPFTIYPMIEIGSTATTYEPYSNICPISGNTETTVYQFGKNIFSMDNINQISLYKNLVSGYWYTDKIVLPPNTTFTISPSETASLGVGDYFVLYINPDSSDPDYLVITNPSIKYVVSAGNPMTVSFTTGNTGVIRFGITSYATQPKQTAFDAFLSIDYQIELGSTATTYEPYKAKTPINIQFNQTVYGADVDAKSGNNNITRIKNTRTLSEFTKGTSSGGYTAYTLADFFGSGVTVQNNNKQLSNITYYTYTGISLGATHFYIGTNGQMNLYLPDSFTDLTLQIEAVAELATPQPFTTDPNNISTYKNNNVFYNTTGDTSVTYYKGV